MIFFFFFFFQAEDGIRDLIVTGVQTCALPICICFGRRRRVSNSIEGPMSLDIQMREKIYSRVCELVARKHFDPAMNGANWGELSKDRKDQILQSNTDDEFEKQIQDLLNELKTSHTGFRHSKSSKIPE